MRMHLVFGAVTLLLLTITVSYSKRKPFAFEDVQKIAQEISGTPYKLPEDPLGKELKKLNYDQIRDIRWIDKYNLWRDKGLPFQVKFIHLGGTFHLPVEIFTVKKNRWSIPDRVIYSSRQFDFGNNVLKDPIPEGLGYAGFRVHYPIKRKDYLDEIFVFLGASYFRSVGKDHQWGLSARGLAIDTTSKKNKEEFPIFTRFWLQQPSEGGTSMIIFALMDSPSVAGAYQFTISPGNETEVKVRSTLYFRKDVKQLGVAPLTSMYWFGENSRPNIKDFRPEVHDSDGLLVHNANDEWLWRPLSNSSYLRENSFIDASTRGFGLLQRDRNFANYQDLEAKYHLRPSAWVVPANEWGKGSVQLVQIPTKDEFIDNVVAFWTPEKPAVKGDILNFDYTLTWLTNVPREPVAHTTQTRIHYPVATEPAWVVIDFASGELENRPADQPPTAEVSTDPPEALQAVYVEKNDFEKTWRVKFSLNVQNLKKPIELRCRLTSDGKNLSETWNDTWRP